MRKVSFVLAVLPYVLFGGPTNVRAAQSPATPPQAASPPMVQQPVSVAAEARIAGLTAKVELLHEQLIRSDEQRAADNEQGAKRMTWLLTVGAVVVTAILGIAGWFVSSRMKEPEEFRDNMRARLDSELASARQAVHDVKQEASTVVKAALGAQQKEAREFFQKHRAEIEHLYTQAKAESEELEQRNATTLKQVRQLVEVGEAPGDKQDADALYYMAEHATADDPNERRVKGLRFLRRLADPSIPANAIVLHNAGVRAKEYDAQELAIVLFQRAAEESGHSPEFESSYAHELALVRRVEQANTLFLKLLDEYPNDEFVGKRYIDAMRALNEHDKIKEYVQSHKELLESSAMVISEYGDYLVERRRLDEAEEVLGRALALDPADDLAWAYLGRLHMIRGDLPEAKKAHEAAIRTATEASPRLGMHFRRLGDVFVAMEKLERAQCAYKASMVADQVPGRAEKWLNIIEHMKKLPADDGSPGVEPQSQGDTAAR